MPSAATTTESQHTCPECQGHNMSVFPLVPTRSRPGEDAIVVELREADSFPLNRAMQCASPACQHIGAAVDFVSAA